jgi:hypothetical protein
MWSARKSTLKSRGGWKAKLAAIIPSYGHNSRIKLVSGRSSNL